jgi:hypothetical protein
MNRNGKGTGPETGATSSVYAGVCWGLDGLSDHRAQRLASHYRKRPSLAKTLVALACWEVQS